MNFDARARLPATPPHDRPDELRVCPLPESPGMRQARTASEIKRHSRAPQPALDAEREASMADEGGVAALAALGWLRRA